MALTNFIPQVWSAAVLTALDEALAYASTGVVNNDYEGDVSEYGGSVVVSTAAEPSVVDYQAYTPMTAVQAASTPQTLLIDQHKAWTVDVDDIDRAQSRDAGDYVSKFSARAAHKLKLEADKFVAGLMNAGLAPANQIAEATISTPEGAYDALVALRTKLSEADVPVQGRWAVVTPAFHGLLLKDSRFVATGDGSAADTRSSGVVGRAAGFTILESNQAPDGPGAGAGKQIIAGHPVATTFANQVTKTEAVRLPDMFVDRMRGLHVYGARVVRPEALAAADIIIA